MKNANESEEKPFYKVIIHSFFVIPFLIAVFCLLLFAAMHLLTREKRSTYDYLNDIKAGGTTKRWQGAFELSKMLVNPRMLPKEERFYSELQNVFENSTADDNRVRQYLALAMGRTGHKVFAEPLRTALKSEKEINVPFLLYALGMLKEKETAADIYPFLEHPDNRIRSIAVVALGNIKNKEAIPILIKALNDPEANVQWGAAIALANMDNGSGKDILLKLMDRSYLSKFKEVDPQEQNHLIIESIKAAGHLNSSELLKRIKELAENDQNMNVRSKAFETLNKK